MRDEDPQAGRRLHDAVEALYTAPGRPKNQTQLAAAANISRTVLDKWWAGAYPTIRTMRRVADALQVPATDLWLAWFGVTRTPGQPALDRIADALERAYPPSPPAGRADPDDDPPPFIDPLLDSLGDEAGAPPPDASRPGDLDPPGTGRRSRSRRSEP